jgi:RNA polymerase sigma-70 factor (ECF subfamily)
MTDPKHRLADWFLRWRAPLRKFLIGKGAVPASELDDVAQEVFLRLMRYGRTELIEHPQAYLYRMAANVAAEWAMRRRYVRSGDPDWLAGLAGEDGGGSALEEASRMQMREDIERALLALTAQQRQVMKLHFYAGLSRGEIAHRTGLSERSVKRALIKSYARLRQELDADGASGRTNNGCK